MESYKFERAISKIKISYGQYHIGKMQFYDVNEKLMVRIGHGIYTQEETIKINNLVGVRVSHEEGDYVRGIQFKLAMF